MKSKKNRLRKIPNINFNIIPEIIGKMLMIIFGILKNIIIMARNLGKNLRNLKELWGQKLFNQKESKRAKEFFIRVLLTFICIISVSGIHIWLTMRPAVAATTIAIEPITWDFVGLDSNKPESQGPNTYVVGARVCNTGSEDALNIKVKFVKDGVDNGYAFIRLQAGDTYYFDRIAKDDLTTTPIRASAYVFDTRNRGGDYKSKYQLSNTPQYCQDFYYNFQVTRTDAAWNTYQKYYIEASGSNTNTIRTEQPRQSYIEKLISQARNEVFFFGCDSSGGSSFATGNVTVQVGDTFTCQARAHTSTDYPQVSFTSDIPNVIFQVLNVNSTYSRPSIGSVNSTVYADGCGWVNNPQDPRYHLSPGACSSETGFLNVYSDQYPYLIPPNEGNGGVGNDIVTTYRIKVIAFPNGIPNPIQVSNIILDYSGSSYHYNSDYGIAPNIISITVANPNPTDLSVTKTHTGNFSYGDNTYTLTVSDNANSTDAKSPVTLTDTLPTGYTFKDMNATKSGTQPLSGANAANWNCDTSGQVMTCLYDTNGDSIGENFPDNTSQTLTLNVNVANGAVPSGTTSTNFAKVALNSAQTDSNTANNTASDPTTILSGADATIAKTHSPATFLVGSTGTYTLTLNNIGNLDAAGPIVVTDTLPSGLVFNSLTTATLNGANNLANWSCGSSGQIVTCQNSTNIIDGKDADGANGTSGDTFVLTFQVTVTSGVATPSVTNTATVSTQTLDIAPSNNTATDPTPTAVPAPDLTISKTDFGAVVQQGGATNDIEYEITVSNVGNNATSGVVTVTDVLNTLYNLTDGADAGTDPDFVKAPGYPVGDTTYQTYVNGGWNCTFTVGTRTLTCSNYAPIPSGGSSTYRIRLRETGGTTVSFPSNTATVTTNGDSNATNNSVTEDTAVAASGSNQDVSVKKCFVSVNGAGTAEISAAEETGETRVVLCGSETSPPSSGATDAQWAAWSDYTGSAPGTINAGSTVIYSILIGNESSAGNTDGANFEDILPPELEFPDNTFGWRCDAITTTGASGGTTACDPADINADGNTVNYPNNTTTSYVQTLPIKLNQISLKKLSGGNPKTPGRVKITVKARVKTPFDGNLSNTATVSALNGANIIVDTTPGNNTSTRAVEVPKPDLSVSKTHTGNFDRDIESTYTITVTNKNTAAGATVEPIIVTDYLPVSAADKAFQYVSASGTGWTCNYDSGTHDVVCTSLTSLAVGANSNPITVKVKPVQSGSFSNKVVAFTANESAFTTDGVRTGATNTDNDDFDPTTVNAPNVNLVLDKSDINPPFDLSKEETYRITVANSGTTQAIAPITITDQLPPGVQFLYAQTINGSPWVCSSTTDALPDNNSNGIFDAGDGNSTADGFETVTCTRYTNITASETPTPTVDLKVLVTAATATGTNSITNQARVTSASDPCTSFSCAATNNRDTTVQTTVNPLSDLAIVKTAVDQDTGTAGNQFYKDGTGVYNITITNNGPSAYSGTVTIDENLTGLPFTYSAHSNSTTWTCTDVNDSNPCASGDQNLRFAKTGGLLAGESSNITLTVNVPNSTGTNFINTASINATTLTNASDPTGDTNDSDTETVDVLNNATTFTLSKDDNDGESPDEPTNADLQTKFVKNAIGKYTIVATNTGLSPGKAPVTISETLPSGLTYAGYSQTANWNCTGTIGLTNISCIYGQWIDTDNDGDRFDVGGSSFTQQDFPIATSSGVEILVNVLNTATTSTLNTTPNPDVYDAGLTTNTASVSASNITSSPITATEQTVIIDPADLAVTKSIVPSPLAASGTGNYTITVTNNGPGTSYPQIYLQDYLPTGLTYTGATSGTALGDGTWTIVGYNSGANEVTYKRTTALANGATTTITLPVSVSASPPANVTNFVRVGGFTPEPDYDTVTPGYQDPKLASCDASLGANQPVNNCFALTTTITGGVSTDLAITKIQGTNNDDPPNPAVNFNTNYSYTLQVANLSGNNAETVTLNDVLPIGLDYVSYSIDAGDVTIPNPYGGTPANLTRTCSYASGTRTFSCNLLRVSTAENNSDPVDITLTVKSQVSGTVNNTATVTSVTADTVTSNNTESEKVLVNPGGANTISGKVFNDKDNGGPTDIDAGETGTANVKVNLYQDTGTVIGAYDSGDSLIATTTTDSNGDYSFTTNLTGNFVLTVDTTTLPIGHSLTPISSPITSQPAVLGTSDINNNFGHKSTLVPGLNVVKRITAINATNITGFEDGPNTTGSDDNDAKWPSANTQYLRGAIACTSTSGTNCNSIKGVQPGQTVEYTIYFLSNGTDNLKNVKICDRIPTNTTFEPNTYATGKGILLGWSSSQLADPTTNTGTDKIQLTNIADTPTPDQGQFYSAGNTLPNPPCGTGSNTNGGVLVDLGSAIVPKATGSGTPVNSYGFVRFNVKVN